MGLRPHSLCNCHSPLRQPLEVFQAHAEYMLPCFVAHQPSIVKCHRKLTFNLLWGLRRPQVLCGPQYDKDLKYDVLCSSGVSILQDLLLRLWRDIGCTVLKQCAEYSVDCPKICNSGPILMLIKPIFFYGILILK